ncbi:MAG: type II toxin-antitoxin system ParD family antitoxin [Methyloligellaceae bacterium]
MAKNTSFKLGDHFDSFISEQVEAGRYGNASEVIRDGLRLLEKENAKLAVLQAELQKGLDSGPSKQFDREAFRKKMTNKHAKNI